MSESVQYMVKDPAGNIYGPATVEMLRQWVAERRIIGSMTIAPQGTNDWQLVSAHPLLADLFVTLSPASNAPQVSSVPLQPGGQSCQIPVNPYAGTHQTNLNYGSSGITGTHPLAIWSLVCGIASMVCCGIPASIAAIIMGFIALQKIKENPNMQGRGMAMAGIITGFCGIPLQCLVFILYAFLMHSGK